MHSEVKRYGFDIYPQEYLEPLILSFELLKRSSIMFCGPDVPFFEKYWCFFYSIPIQFLHYITLSAFIVKLFTEGNDPYEKPDMIPMWFICNEHWIKMTILLINGDQIREVIMVLGSTWRTKGLNEKQMKIKNTALKQLYYGEILFIKVGLVICSLYILVNLGETVIRRLILGQDAELQLPYACVYPFDTSTWPVYLTMFGVQTYCTFRSAYLYLGVSWLIVVLTSHLNVQFLLLQEDLINLRPNPRCNSSNFTNQDELAPSEDSAVLTLKDFVRRHQVAILTANKLNASFSKFTFAIMLFATLIICFFAVAIKASPGDVHALKNYGAMTVVLVNIFVLSYYGQLLSSSSSGIAEAAANNEWYKGDKDYQTNIRFIIMRSQKPCSLTLLDFSPISLKTFNKVLKTTWSYFSLASQMYDERD